MKGISLQNMEKHRKALAAYKKIPADSPQYIAARINMAIADIRQDWWTDAYDILTDLLKNPGVINNKTLSDRIHTIIGYIFLQQEYFRNSRDAFRKVELHGSYTNQALLGIALDAGYQKDYVGALNACRILKRKQSKALQVDEANLLVPYFYEKLGQMSTASAGYSEAIKYYENRLQVLKTAMDTPISHSVLTDLKNHSTMINVGRERIDLGKYLPKSFFIQISLLSSYKKYIDSIGEPKLNDSYDKLQNEYIRLIRNIVNMKLKEKSNYISDYMNQCRYGLARLYDKNPSDTK